MLKKGGQFLLVERGARNQALIDEIIKQIGEIEVNMVTNLSDPYMVACAVKSNKENIQPAGVVGNRSTRRQAKKGGVSLQPTAPP